MVFLVVLYPVLIMNNLLVIFEQTANASLTVAVTAGKHPGNALFRVPISIANSTLHLWDLRIWTDLNRTVMYFAKLIGKVKFVYGRGLRDTIYLLRFLINNYN